MVTATLLTDFSKETESLEPAQHAGPSWESPVGSPPPRKPPGSDDNMLPCVELGLWPHRMSPQSKGDGLFILGWHPSPAETQVTSQASEYGQSLNSPRTLDKCPDSMAHPGATLARP